MSTSRVWIQPWRVAPGRGMRAAGQEETKHEASFGDDDTGDQSESQGFSRMSRSPQIAECRPDRYYTVRLHKQGLHHMGGQNKIRVWRDAIIEPAALGTMGGDVSWGQAELHGAGGSPQVAQAQWG